MSTIPSRLVLVTAWLTEQEREAWRGQLERTALPEARIHRDLQDASGLDARARGTRGVPDRPLRCVHRPDPAGRCAIELAAPVHVSAVRQLVFDDLTEDQVATLRDMTCTVLARLEPAASDATHADQTDATTSTTPEDP